MSWPMRRASWTSVSSKRSISSARERSTGSPYLRTCLTAAARRARVSGSSRSVGSATSPWASVCTSSATRSDSKTVVDHVERTVDRLLGQQCAHVALRNARRDTLHAEPATDRGPVALVGGDRRRRGGERVQVVDRECLAE